jgi:hypothetical protein
MHDCAARCKGRRNCQETAGKTEPVNEDQPNPNPPAKINRVGNPHSTINPSRQNELTPGERTRGQQCTSSMDDLLKASVGQRNFIAA